MSGISMRRLLLQLVILLLSCLCYAQHNTVIVRPKPINDVLQNPNMNRAAEQAAPQAKQIFLAALKQMSFDDARQILTGGDTAATQYFQRTSTPDLTAAFSPIVQRSMIETKRKDRK